MRPRRPNRRAGVAVAGNVAHNAGDFWPRRGLVKKARADKSRDRAADRSGWARPARAQFGSTGLDRDGYTHPDPEKRQNMMAITIMLAGNFLIGLLERDAQAESDQVDVGLTRDVVAADIGVAGQLETNTEALIYAELAA